MISRKCIGCNHRIEGDEVHYDEHCLNPGTGIPCDLWSRRRLSPYEMEMITVYRMICDGQYGQAIEYIEKIFSQKGIPKEEFL